MIIVTVKTITIGLKGKRVLSSCGIKSTVVKIEAGASEGGCQYGLQFSEKHFYDAVSALRENGIEYGVYKPK